MTQSNRFLSWLAPLLAVCAIVVAPLQATAQPGSKFPPVISSFEVIPSDQLVPGSDLEIRVTGTPHGQARVRFSGVNKTIVLKEVERGVYEGSYTLSRRDRLGPQPTSQATLRVRNQSTTANLALVNPPPPPVATRPPVPAPLPSPTPVAAAPTIERFGVTPVARIEPGAELRFTLFGTPAARALLTIDGVVRDVAMQEVRPGRYEGAYTIRRNDNFPPSLNIVGTLEANGQITRSRLNQALLVDARPPTIRNLAPRNNETIAANPVSVSATFDDSGGVGVDPKSVKFFLGGQDLTGSASITPQFLTWRGELRPGNYPVDITAADNAGNSVRQTWTFIVAGPQAAVPAATLPLEIINHANNAQVGSGVVEVRGRTAPDAKVDIQVQAIAAVAGFFGINQQILNQSVRSDASGNFVFSFQPQVPVPGARYESTITATKGNLTRELKLVLFQQR